MQSTREIPYSRIDTLFLDLGNTLISFDADWVCRELASKGTRCRPAQLRRAEAAARPGFSGQKERPGEGEGFLLFQFYFCSVLKQLEKRGTTLSLSADRLAAELTPILRPPGGTARLWSSVLPGVPQALEDLRAAGFKLALVSNSDGSVDQALNETGLRRFFDVVIDSHLVGFEKPDPRIFAHALSLSGSVGRTTLHVGDLYDIDVVGARGAGLFAALLDPYDDWGEVDCARFSDLTALKQALLDEPRARPRVQSQGSRS